MTKEPTPRLRRKFAIAGWNCSMRELKGILRRHPGAVHWTDDLSGMTALHGAAAQCGTAAIKLLVAAGADINARDDKGRTPLMHGAGNGGKTHVQALLDAGADTGATDNEGHDAIYYTSDLLPQPQNAEIIRRHAQMQVLKALADWETHWRADIDGVVAQMHSGAAKPVAVGRPIKFRR